MLGVRLLLLHADRQRLDPPREQERVVRAQAAPGAVDNKVHLVTNGCIIARYHAGHYIVMTGEVLGAGFVNDIGAEIQRVGEHGREHGVVHHDESFSIGIMSRPRNGGDVNDLDEGVGRCLQENHSRLLVYELGDAIGVGGVDVVDDYSLIGGQICEQSVRATVQVVAGDDLVARSEAGG